MQFHISNFIMPPEIIPCFPLLHDPLHELDQPLPVSTKLGICVLQGFPYAFYGLSIPSTALFVFLPGTTGTRIVGIYSPSRSRSKMILSF